MQREDTYVLFLKYLFYLADNFSQNHKDIFPENNSIDNKWINEQVKTIMKRFNLSCHTNPVSKLKQLSQITESTEKFSNGNMWRSSSLDFVHFEVICYAILIAE